MLVVYPQLPHSGALTSSIPIVLLGVGPPGPLPGRPLGPEPEPVPVPADPLAVVPELHRGCSWAAFGLPRVLNRDRSAAP
jgi:hypothetical protein